MFRLALIAVLVTLTGCAQIPLGTPVPTVENVQYARADQMDMTSVGEFFASKDVNDISINIRSNEVFSPVDKSFAHYLRETLITELKAAGVYAEKSDLVIEGELTRSSSLAPTDIGHAELAAWFRVRRKGILVFEKELTEVHSWPSSFLGVSAIPTAIGEYTALYRKLVGQLLQDAEFRRAVANK